MASIISLFQRFFPQDTSYAVEIKQNKCLEMFKRMKEKTLEIHEKRKKLLKDFESEFKYLIDEYFPIPPYGTWTFKKKDITMLELENWVLSDQSLGFQCIKTNMRKLFFTDFVSFCYKFEAEINSMVIEEMKDGHCFDEDYLYEMFSGLNFLKEYSKTDNINIDFLENVQQLDINISFLLYKLQTMVEEHTGNSIEVIRMCLFYNPGFSFDVNENRNIRDFCSVITFFLKYYGADYYTWDKKRVSSFIPRPPHCVFLDEYKVIKVLIDHYQKYLIVDIESEYKASNDSINDARFTTYRKYRDALLKCCLGENKNLVVISCIKHQKIFNYIRLNYYETNSGHLYIDQSIFNENIIDMIRSMYEYFYQKRVSRS
ncbi:hypothetical protein CDIK_1802 [Cucumispora dikerogammari]|nr:hypothetical protein CDIK_1802 [Cucumispora dikerogammari]